MARMNHNRIGVGKVAQNLIEMRQDRAGFDQGYAGSITTGSTRTRWCRIGLADISKAHKYVRI